MNKGEEKNNRNRKKYHQKNEKKRKENPIRYIVKIGLRD